jgi:hypothetical protein
MFGSEPGLRRIVPGDFHVPLGQAPGAGVARNLWLEADFAFPELIGVEPQPTVPPHFTHMRMESADSVPTVRFRLTAELDEDGEINQDLAHVLAVGDDGEPIRTAAVNRYDRGAIQVHYLPARRDPADHVSYAANSLLGRLLRAADFVPTCAASMLLTLMTWADGTRHIEVACHTSEAQRPRRSRIAPPSQSPQRSLGLTGRFARPRSRQARPRAAETAWPFEIWASVLLSQ